MDSHQDCYKRNALWKIVKSYFLYRNNFTWKSRRHLLKTDFWLLVICKKKAKRYSNESVYQHQCFEIHASLIKRSAPCLPFSQNSILHSTALQVERIPIPIYFIMLGMWTSCQLKKLWWNVGQSHLERRWQYIHLKSNCSWLQTQRLQDGKYILNRKCQEF